MEFEISSKQIVTDDELNKAFENTNYGNINHRKHLEVSVFKKLVGYESGWTTTTIMIELGLISNKTGKVTAKGKNFVRHAYHTELLEGWDRG